MFRVGAVAVTGFLVLPAAPVGVDTLAAAATPMASLCPLPDTSGSSGRRRRTRG